jgi:hypothetical protein
MPHNDSTCDEGDLIIKTCRGKTKMWPHGDITSFKVELKKLRQPNWEYVELMDLT